MDMRTDGQTIKETAGRTEGRTDGQRGRQTDSRFTVHIVNPPNIRRTYHYSLRGYAVFFGRTVFRMVGR